MWELRWILAGLGVALIAGLYAWGRITSRRSAATPPAEAQASAEPESDPEQPAAAPPEPPKRQGADKIITLRLVPKSEELRSEAVVLALREAGLRLGRYGIFHLQTMEQEAAFSVASLLEPGSFDLENLQDSTMPGMSFFMVLPGTGDPVTRFDLMVQTARALAVELDAELFDDRGSSWSIQRERYMREELVEYRHQIGRALR
jgi:cell division protein ZipA